MKRTENPNDNSCVKPQLLPKFRDIKRSEALNIDSVLNYGGDTDAVCLQVLLVVGATDHDAVCRPQCELLVSMEK